MLLGTLLNVAAVIIGSLLGLFLRDRFPENIQKIVVQGLGLTSIFLGLQMALKATDVLLLIFSVLIGAIIGELLHLELRLEGVGDLVKRRLKIKTTGFTEGLLTAFLLFCVGPMTIIGTINEGLRGDHTLLFTKSLLDGFAAIALAASYGVGVLFSAAPLFLFQAILTVLASFTSGFFSDAIIAQLSGVGGVMVLGLGLKMLGIAKIPVANFLPSLVVAVLLMLIFV